MWELAGVREYWEQCGGAVESMSAVAAMVMAVVENGGGAAIRSANASVASGRAAPEHVARMTRVRQQQASGGEVLELRGVMWALWAEPDRRRQVVESLLQVEEARQHPRTSGTGTPSRRTSRGET